MKKIFFIINGLSGGVATLFMLIAEHLDSKKYEIGLMEIIHNSDVEWQLGNNIRVYPYYTLATAPDRKERMYYVFHEWDKVIEEYIPQDYDLYVSFNYLRPSFLLPAGKRCIAWIHTDVYDLASKEMQEERQLQREAFYKADRIVTISDITTQSVIDLFPEHKEKIQILYNGIDIEEIHRRSLERTDVKLEHPCILAIGRLDDNKNPLRLLWIFAKLHKKEPKAHLYYLGCGKLEQEVRNRSVELGVENQVHLLGYYKNPFPIITQCDVIGMFSRHEGFPMALLEGAALGKPFVSSVIGGARLLADNGKCGQVVETDEEAVKALLQYLQGDREDQGQKCRKSVERFAVDHYIKQVEKLFDEVMEI